MTERLTDEQIREALEMCEKWPASYRKYANSRGRDSFLLDCYIKSESLLLAALHDLLAAREENTELREVLRELRRKLAVCPFCNHYFDESDELGGCSPNCCLGKAHLGLGAA